jgi:hypothetical protein
MPIIILATIKIMVIIVIHVIGWVEKTNPKTMKYGKDDS